jgi:hypothetical protein
MADVQTCLNEIRVTSWAELHDVLYEGSWQEPLRRFRSTYAYRGMPCNDFDLTTSLGRLGPSANELETHLLRSFRKYAHHHAVPNDSTWHWLALAQHHGLPTRMLDWSYSPYVGLHFVTEALEHYHEDGVIWRVDYAQTNHCLPESLQKILAAEGAAVQVFTAEMLEQAAPSLSEFDALSTQEFILFFEPPSLDERIVNQYALFSMMSDVHCNVGDWLAQHPAMYSKLIIPADLKWEIRDKLDQANITERVLYPGLDGLSLWLRRYYLPRPE